MVRLSARYNILLRALIALGVLYLVFRYGADMRATFSLISSAAVTVYIMGLLAAAFGEFLTAAKWQMLLQVIGQRVRLAFLYKVSLTGMFYNNLLPGSVGGDVVRILLTAHKAGGKSRAAASIFMQRNTGFAGLLIVANIASWIPPLRLRVFPQPFTCLNLIGVWFAFLGAVYILINIMLVHPGIFVRVSSMLDGTASQAGLPGRVSRELSGPLHRFHNALCLSSRGWIPALVYSLATQLADSFSVYLASRALGMHLPFQWFCVFVPVTTVTALLPITVNGIGLREACYLLLLESQGVSPERAVAVSMMHFSYILLLSLFGGFLQVVAPTSAAQRNR